MKMENLIVCILCISLLANIVVAQETNVTNETNVTTVENVTNITNATVSDAMVNSAAIEARYENVKYGYEKTLAAMGAVIGYLGNKTDTATLIGLQDNFTSLFNELQQYIESNNASGFGKQVAEMHKVAAQFKSSTAKATSPGEMGDLKKLVQNRTAAKENETEMKELKGNVSEKKGKAYNLACELNLERIKTFITNLKTQNISIEDMQNVSMPLSELCTNISRIRNETELNSRIDGIKEKLNAAKVKIIEKGKIANEKAMDRAIAVVSALENRGVNVSGMKEKLETINATKEAMNTACANVISEESREECKEKINALREGVSNIGEQIKVTIRNNSGLIQKKGGRQ